MERDSQSYRIARALAEAWTFHHSPAFIEYARETFGITLEASLKCDAIYIGEAEEGDVTLGSIGGMMRQWWVVNDREFTLLEYVHLPRVRDDPENVRGDYYLVPVIKFFVQNGLITVGEAFGPMMHCRKIGRVVFGEDAAEIRDLRVVWNSQT